MNELPPVIAAKAAEDVYALTKTNTLENALLTLNNKYGGLLTFPFSDDNLLKGKTGGPAFIKARTAFGFVLVGKGALEGHAFIIFRGTQYLADWLTNLNISSSSSDSGWNVHDGFNKSFKSMSSQITHFMGLLNKYNIHTINCIGHSLGGALATICGEWIKANYDRTPKIYTFGSPRVGQYDFATFCTSSVGAKNIYRAFHKTDIVPCIPIWPYIHTPIYGKEYWLHSPGLIPMAEYHGMDKYVDSVKGKTWDYLSGLREAYKSDASIIQWLKEKGISGITVSALDWLTHALIWVLKKCSQGANWLALKSFGPNFTFMDQLSYILARGINIIEGAGEWVLYLVNKILHILGGVASVKIEDLNSQFISEVLKNLQHRVNQFTRDTLSKVLVNGRAI